MFLNRQRELAYLESRYARPGAGFAVLYGRGRVGKTTLVYEWCGGRSWMAVPPSTAATPGPTNCCLSSQPTFVPSSQPTVPNR